MRELPTGTVTFLFTDVEGSTKLLHELGAEAYADALAEHRRVIREACAAEGGVEVDTQGDAFFFAFPTAPGALAAAAAIHRGARSRADPGARRPAHGHAAAHRRGLRRRRRPLRRRASPPRRTAARSSSRSATAELVERRADRPRRAPAQGHRRSRSPIFQLGDGALSAAEDDLQHEPAAPGELVRRPGRRARRRCCRGSRTARASSRSPAPAARARRGSRSRPPPRSFPSTRRASSGSGSPRCAIRRSSRRRSPRRSAPRTASPSTSATGSCCSCSTTSSR